jgi:multidrug resistance efflux pump
MEEEYDRVTDKLQAEIDHLKEKKEHLRENIRQDIASLLERRWALLELKEDQRRLGRLHDHSFAELKSRWIAKTPSRRGGRK